MHCSDFQSGVCRSCGHLDRTYERSLADKRAGIAELFPGVMIGDWVTCVPAAGSRIRARLAITGTSDDARIGFLDEHRQLVAVDQCPLHHPLINEWTQGLPDLIREAQLTPYDPAIDRGELKFVVVTCSPSHQQLMVQFVLRSREAVDRVRRLWQTGRMQTNTTVRVASINLQPVRSSLINGPDEIALSDDQRLPMTFGGIELLFGPGSFVQTNHSIAEKLYQAAAAHCEAAGAWHVLDLYCGAGAFGLTVARSVSSVFGVDSSADATGAAAEAARRNGIGNARFECRRLDQPAESAAWLEPGGEPFDTIICNPPRRGLDSMSLSLIHQLSPQCVIYSSCNPTTLARDTQLLASAYAIEHLQPFDMFPFTSHCEVLALLTRRD